MKVILLILSFFYYLNVNCQISDICSSSHVVCDHDQVSLSINSVTPNFPAYGGISNPSTNPNLIPGNAGCLISCDINSIWLIVSPLTKGTLEFVISTEGVGFLDWAMWPYDSLLCDNLSLDTIPPVACNSNASSTGMTGIAQLINIPAGGDPGNFESPISVVGGEQFIICISNFSSLFGFLSFDNVGTSSMCQSSIGISESSIDEILLLNGDNSISLTGFSESFDLRVYDFQGRERLQLMNYKSDELISVEQLPSAPYLIRLENEERVEIIRYFKL